MKLNKPGVAVRSCAGFENRLVCCAVVSLGPLADVVASLLVGSSVASSLFGDVAADAFCNVLGKLKDGAVGAVGAAPPRKLNAGLLSAAASRPFLLGCRKLNPDDPSVAFSAGFFAAPRKSKVGLL